MIGTRGGRLTGDDGGGALGCGPQRVIEEVSIAQRIVCAFVCPNN